jgi:hypothetical protein
MIIKFECQCGSIEGTVDTKHAKGYRAVCLCDDCQAAAKFLGKESEILDVYGGTDIFPMQPANLKFTKGVDQLKCFRLSPKGMFRWYAGCCKTSIANIPAERFMPYVGVVHTILDKNNDAKKLEEAFGPVNEYMQAKYGKGELPKNSYEKVSLGFMLRVIKFVLTAKIRGEGNPSPFYNSDGSLAVNPYVLTEAERAALR